MNTDSTTWLGRTLNFVAVLGVGYYFTRLAIDGLQAWVLVVGYLAIALWTALIVIARRWRAATLVLASGVVVLGSLVMVASNGVMIAAVGLVVLRVSADLRWPAWVGVLLGVVAAAVTATGEFIVAFPLLGLLSIEAAIAVAILGGLSRRQYRIADQQARALIEDRERAAAVADRQAVARDIHDVLAHSLGGLVIQLDAAEALLEAGDVAGAGRRVHDARALAASGLAEAKRAVGALRADESPGSSIDIVPAIEELAKAHRSLGGVVTVRVTGASHPLAAGEAQALLRTVQESLTNARKHAVGQPVRIAFRWTRLGAELEIDNPLGEKAALSATGGAHGLTGMAERFDALPHSTFSAGERSDRFVVSAAVGRA